MLALSRYLPGFVRGGLAGRPCGRRSGWPCSTPCSSRVLFLLTLPLTILTLGLFLLVLNAFMLWLTAQFVHGFDIPGGFFTTLVASIVLSVVGVIWKATSRA